MTNRWLLYTTTAGALLATRPARAAGNAKVFDLGSELDPFKFTLMMTLVLLGLVMFDMALEAFENYLHRLKGRFHRRLHNKALKQLMVLGTISFVLFVLQDQAVIDKSDLVLSNTFNFVNLFLFFVGVALIGAAVVLVKATYPIKARWDTYANADLKMLLALHKDTTSTNWIWDIVWFPRLLRGLRRAQVIEYHLFRSVFLRLNRSLLTPAFDFSKYSAAIMDEFIIDFFDVRWASWLVAILLLFVTVPITNDLDDSGRVSVYGAVCFGGTILVCECLICAYVHYAHKKVIAGMGSVNGFRGMDKVLQELWVEPRHHMDEATSAIDVKDLLAAAPVQAPTLEQLTTELDAEGAGASQAIVNFGAGDGPAFPIFKRRPSGGELDFGGDSFKPSSSEIQHHNLPSAGDALNIDVNPVSPTPAFAAGGIPANGAATENSTPAKGNPTIITAATDPASTSAVSASVESAVPDVRDTNGSVCQAIGLSCAGCLSCDPLWLPPAVMRSCSVDGDAFVLRTLSVPQSIAERLPGTLKGVSVKVGSHWCFRALFGACTLQKCYYCAFFFSYIIGRATTAGVVEALMWVLLTPLPLLLCFLPLAKRTLPVYAQLACLQGGIVWEVVSDLEEQQEMAARARAKVVSKLQETLHRKTEQHEAGVYGLTDPWNVVSPRSRAMKNWFRDWDKDGSGRISKEELARGLQKLGVYLSSAELQQLFRLADRDHSKAINLDEFKAFLSDIESLEYEPERLRRDIDLRLRRASIRLSRKRSAMMEKSHLLPRPHSSSSVPSRALRVLRSRHWVGRGRGRKDADTVGGRKQGIRHSGVRGGSTSVNDHAAAIDPSGHTDLVSGIECQTEGRVDFSNDCDGTIRDGSSRDTNEVVRHGRSKTGVACGDIVNGEIFGGREATTSLDESSRSRRAISLPAFLLRALAATSVAGTSTSERSSFDHL